MVAILLRRSNSGFMINVMYIYLHFVLSGSLIIRFALTFCLNLKNLFESIYCFLEYYLPHQRKSSIKRPLSPAISEFLWK